jgi:hypothetical protein
MSPTVQAALIAGAVSIICALLSAFIVSSRTVQELKVSRAVTDTKIEDLTREVREHNNFARRMPVVEEQIKVINHRIEDLEHQKGA